MRLALLFLLLTSPALAQGTPANMCAAGTVVQSQLLNTGQSCSPVTGPVGTYVVQLNQAAAFGAQTICDTTSACPAGFVTVHAYVNTITAGTLVSAVSSFITYTDDGGLKSNVSLGSALSLLTATGISYTWNFYHAANTAVTVNTTTATLTGSPTYNFRARLIWLGN